VIYEMSAGHALEQELPTDADCAAVKGDKDGIRAVLSFIFSMSDSVASGAMSYKEGLQRVSGVCSRYGHVRDMIVRFHQSFQVKSHTFFIISAPTQVDLSLDSSEVG
jgi:hypothetical protein